MLPDTIPRSRFCHTPTPLEPMAALSRHLGGPNLFVKRDDSSPQVALTIANICAIGERGLLGIAVDPDFADNHHIYLYYTHKVNNICNTTTNPANRVARDTASIDAAADYKNVE